MTEIHQPVLLDEVVGALKPAPGKVYIDATLGGGGHTRALLQQGAEVVGIDQDIDALTYVRSTLTTDKLKIVEANFMTIKTQAEKYNLVAVDGILFDLGVSSLQFDTPNRGFSFQFEAPLDMRMSRTNPVSAADIVNGFTEDELYELLVGNAQEPKARQIAAAIVAHRPIHSTTALADIITSVYGKDRGKLHPATLTFQALRIAVNQELKIIKPALKDAFTLLKPGGRLCVISFHEGEDRIVKRTFNELVTAGEALPVTKKPVVPSPNELQRNPRSRSAKLRVIERQTCTIESTNHGHLHR